MYGILNITIRYTRLFPNSNPVPLFYIVISDYFRLFPDYFQDYFPIPPIVISSLVSSLFPLISSYFPIVQLLILHLLFVIYSNPISIISDFLIISPYFQPACFISGYFLSSSYFLQSSSFVEQIEQISSGYFLLSPLISSSIISAQFLFDMISDSILSSRLISDYLRLFLLVLLLSLFI